MNQNLLSIVTITYNSSKTIGKLLLSLEKESSIIRDVFIIENNSPDKEKTKSIVNLYKEKYNHLYKIHFIEMDDNYGFAYSCNYGAKLSKTKYVLFLNPDAEINNDSLSILMRHAVKHSAAIAGGKVISYKNSLHRTVVKKPNILVGLFEFTNLGKLFKINIGQNLFYYDISKIKDDVLVDAIGGAFLLVSKKDFLDLGGFDENFFMYLEDVDLGIRAKQSNMNVLFCPHSSVMHVGGASSKNKYKIHHKAWFDSRSYFFKKHFSILTNLVIQPLFFIEKIILFVRFKLSK